MTSNYRQNSLIKGTSKSLIERSSSSLVQRGLADIARFQISLEEIRSICSGLEDFNFDIRAEAAQTISRRSSEIKAKQEYIEMVVFPLVYNLEEYFDKPSGQLTLFECGERYYPPNNEFKYILLNALVSIVGNIDETGDAVLEILQTGTVQGKIKSIEWLAERTLSSTLFGRSFNEIDSLCHSPNEGVRLAAIYAMTCFGNTRPDAVYKKLIDECISNSQSAEIKSQVRNYLEKFPHSTLEEQGSLGRMLTLSFTTLLNDSAHENIKCARIILDEWIMGSLGEYSLEELESDEWIMDSYLGEYSLEELESIVQSIEIYYPNKDDQIIEYIEILKALITQRER